MTNVAGYVLEARNISKRFGRVQAIEDITLQLGHSEVLALVGDNGARQVDADQDYRRGVEERLRGDPARWSGS